MRSRLGVSLAQFAAWLFRDPVTYRDPTYYAAEALATAYNAIQQLKENGSDLELQGRSLITPHLEAAWNELLYVRSQQPAESLKEHTLTRYGRINE